MTKAQLTLIYDHMEAMIDEIHSIYNKYSDEMNKALFPDQELTDYEDLDMFFITHNVEWDMDLLKLRIDTNRESEISDDDVDKLFMFIRNMHREFRRHQNLKGRGYSDYMLRKDMFSQFKPYGEYK